MDNCAYCKKPQIENLTFDRVNLFCRSCYEKAKQNKIPTDFFISLEKKEVLK